MSGAVTIVKHVWQDKVKDNILIKVTVTVTGPKMEFYRANHTIK